MKHKILPKTRRKQIKEVDIAVIRNVAISITGAMSEMRNNLNRFLNELSTEISKINQKHG